MRRAFRPVLVGMCAGLVLIAVLSPASAQEAPALSIRRVDATNASTLKGADSA